MCIDQRLDQSILIPVVGVESALVYPGTRDDVLRLDAFDIFIREDFSLHLKSFDKY